MQTVTNAKRTVSDPASAALANKRIIRTKKRNHLRTTHRRYGRASSIPPALTNLCGLFILPMRNHRLPNVEGLDQTLPCCIVNAEDGLMLLCLRLSLLLKRFGRRIFCSGQLRHPPITKGQGKNLRRVGNPSSSCETPTWPSLIRKLM